MIRSFWFGSTSANRVLPDTRCHSASSRILLRSDPVTIRSMVMPTVSATWRATSWLSPVMIVVCTPSLRSADNVGSTSGSGGSKNSRNPRKERSFSSSLSYRSFRNTPLTARPSTRYPWALQPAYRLLSAASRCSSSFSGPLAARTVPHLSSTRSSAPLVTSSGPPRSACSTTTLMHLRTKSYGISASLLQPSADMPPSDPASATAVSRGLARPVGKTALRIAYCSTSLLASPSASRQ